MAIKDILLAAEEKWIASRISDIGNEIIGKKLKRRKNMTMWDQLAIVWDQPNSVFAIFFSAWEYLFTLLRGSLPWTVDAIVTTELSIHRYNEMLFALSMMKSDVPLFFFFFSATGFKGHFSAYSVLLSL